MLAPLGSGGKDLRSQNRRHERGSGLEQERVEERADDVVSRVRNLRPDHLAVQPQLAFVSAEQPGVVPAAVDRVDVVDRDERQRVAQGKEGHERLAVRHHHLGLELLRQPVQRSHGGGPAAHRRGQVAHRRLPVVFLVVRDAQIPDFVHGREMAREIRVGVARRDEPDVVLLDQPLDDDARSRRVPHPFAGDAVEDPHYRSVYRRTRSGKCSAGSQLGVSGRRGAVTTPDDEDDRPCRPGRSPPARAGRGRFRRRRSRRCRALRRRPPPPASRDRWSG